MGVDLETILVTLTNISRYLYKKYGAYKVIDEEIDTMVTTLYNPILAEKVARETEERVARETVERVSREITERNALKLARNMLRKGMSQDLIVELAEVSVEQIEEIKKEIEINVQ